MRPNQGIKLWLVFRSNFVNILWNFDACEKKTRNSFNTNCTLSKKFKVEGPQSLRPRPEDTNYLIDNIRRQ